MYQEDRTAFSARSSGRGVGYRRSRKNRYWMRWVWGNKSGRPWGLRSSLPRTGWTGTRREDFFGIVYDGRLYLKTDETTREKYRGCGMGPFAPSEKQVLKSYYEVPEEIVEEERELASWAREASVLN